MKSAKLYQFPQPNRNPTTSIQQMEASSHAQQRAIKTNSMAGLKNIMSWTMGLLWLFLAMFWPLLNWIAAMDVVFQCVRALYYSNTPAIHATLQASIHGVLFILLSLFVYLYRPKVF